VVREAEMIAVLQERPDLVAVLDVTHPEPPAPDSPLYTLPNVILTPHIAGALGTESLRMGQYAVAEIERYVAGQTLKYALQPERVAILA
jgi:phosphoglycerate dehydrogenase-like enzyme